MGSALAMHDVEFSREQLELLKQTVAKGTSDLEFDLFLATARRLRLDPFRRQIYCMPTWEGQGDDRKRTFKSVVSIDGFRASAEDTGEYEGQTKPEWFDSETLTWVDVWFGENHPVAARIGIYRRGFREPLYRVARFDAYVQTTKDGKPNSQWRKMGAEQLLKCAEALAFRAAFPGPLSGAYTDDEMGQASDDEPEPKRPPAAGQQPSQPATPQPTTPVQLDTELRFVWQVNERFHQTRIMDAPPHVIVLYVTHLNGLINGKGNAGYKQRVTVHKNLVQRVFEEVRDREQRATAQKVSDELNAERAKRAATPEGMRSVGDMIQDVIDGHLPDPSDEQPPTNEG